MNNTINHIDCRLDHFLIGSRDFNSTIGEILQDTKKVEYIISMKKVIKRGVVVGVGNGIVKADEKTIYHAEGLKVGLIK